PLAPWTRSRRLPQETQIPPARAVAIAPIASSTPAPASEWNGLHWLNFTQPKTLSRTTNKPPPPRSNAGPHRLFGPESDNTFSKLVPSNRSTSSRPVKKYAAPDGLTAMPLPLQGCIGQP